jgi:hypothetical protein
VLSFHRAAQEARRAEDVNNRRPHTHMIDNAAADNAFFETLYRFGERVLEAAFVDEDWPKIQGELHRIFRSKSKLL